MSVVRKVGDSRRGFMGICWVLCCLAGIGSLPASAEATKNPIRAQTAVGLVLDDFHAAAAEADAERYLGHFAANGVFMGTDDWERWPLPAFREYVEKRFADGGWAYEPRSRNIRIDGDHAWFDEIVESSRWGRFRGTGVLQRIDGDWKIAHYALSFLIPNEIWEPVSRSAREGFEARKDAEAQP